MDLLIVVAVVAALAVGAFLGLLLRRQAPRGSPEIAALTGRLSQMAESQTAVQNAIIERLQAQERVGVTTVDERLQGFPQLVGDRPTAPPTNQQTAPHHPPRPP